MPTETRVMKPDDGFPISYTNTAAGVSKLADSPGVNLSYYITGFIMSGAGNGDSFSFLRRASLTFDVSSDTFTVSDDAALEPVGGDFAIVFGIKTSDHTLGSMISKWEATDKGYNIEVLNTGQVKVTFGDGTTTASITSTRSIHDGNWHQVVINWEYQETDGLSMYIDGESVADAVTNASLSDVTGGAGDLVIVGSDGKSFDISTLGLYKAQILSSAEIAALWNGGVGHKFTGSETGLSAAWNIDEAGTETAHLDLVGSNDGTSSGTAWNDGDGFPTDPHTLKETITYTAGIIDLYPSAAGADYAGVIQPIIVNFPHAIKIGRNNPIRIKESSGGWSLELFGYSNIYQKVYIVAQAIDALDNLIKERLPKKIMPKKSRLLSALFKKSRMKKETARKKRYLQHYKKAGPKHAMTYVEWQKKGEQSTYFKGAGGKARTVEAQLREAGIDPKRFKKK